MAHRESRDRKRLRLQHVTPFIAHDKDQYMERLSGRFRRLRQEVISGKEFYARLHIAPLNMLSATTSYALAGREIWAEADFYYLVLWNAGIAECTAGGRSFVVGPGEGALFAPGDNHFRFRTAQETVAITFPAHIVHGPAERLYYTPITGPIVPQGALPNPVVSLVWRRVNDILDELEAPINIFENVPHPGGQLEIALLETVLLTTPSNYMPLPEKLVRNIPTVDKERVNLVREYMEAHQTGPKIGLANFAAVADTSATTIEASFKKIYGKGPIAIFRDMRLEGARYELQHPGPDTSVESVQAKYHFSSKFAAVYESAYHEAPRETLRVSRLRLGVRHRVPLIL